MVPKVVTVLEFVASQGFDFPTQYIAPQPAGYFAERSGGQATNRPARRDILLNAKNLCLDLILLNQEKTLMDIRMKKCG